MEQSKKKKIVIIIAICILVIGGLVFGWLKAKPIIHEKLIERLEGDGFSPAVPCEDAYHFKYNGEYLIDAWAFISGGFCSIHLDGKEPIKFSEKNMQIVEKFFDEKGQEWWNTGTIEIYDSELTENEKLIMKSVIYNDESYLDSISN